MKCRDCGAEVANVGELKKHKADCPGKQEVLNEAQAMAPAQEPASLEAIQRMASELGIGYLLVKESKYLVVPRRFLPDEVKYMGTNQYVGLKLRGYLSPEGLVVQEKTEFIR